MTRLRPSSERPSLDRCSLSIVQTSLTTRGLDSVSVSTRTCIDSWVLLEHGLLTLYIQHQDRQLITNLFNYMCIACALFPPQGQFIAHIPTSKGYYTHLGGRYTHPPSVPKCTLPVTLGHELIALVWQRAHRASTLYCSFDLVRMLDLGLHTSAIVNGLLVLRKPLSL